MTLRRTIGATLAPLFVAAGTALAQETAAPASLALSSTHASFTVASTAPASIVLDTSAPASFVVAPGASASLARAALEVSGAPSHAMRSAPRLDAVGYRPRSRGYSGGYAHAAPAQVHAGFFEPNGGGPTSFAIGIRGGPAIDEHVQLGFGVDWYRKSESRREVVGETFQGGQSILATRVLARASSNLIPLQAFLQVNGGTNLPVIPYAGVAGQYQVLALSATDYQTGADFDATFGGWGWQVWGGAALPLSGRSRVFGEAFANTGDVERDVDDPASGLTFRESVDSDGLGMRFGVSWGF